MVWVFKMRVVSARQSGNLWAILIKFIGSRRRQWARRWGVAALLLQCITSPSPACSYSSSCFLLKPDKNVSRVVGHCWQDRQGLVGVHIWGVANPPSDSPLLESSRCCNVVTHVDDQAQLTGQVTATVDNKAEKSRQFKTWNFCCCLELPFREMLIKNLKNRQVSFTALISWGQKVTICSFFYSFFVNLSLRGLDFG